ncbi:ubiquitin-conjugating enzyme E2-16 kDa [Westerdykella ornata]|uniref:E2 ubiquitin-conjugating enzyme n=1 Tax=Westerdykella ornata TaxID=318751 RepID=A0A6A6JUF1_WESOR|nr:ubiquitin-conjugating enzyme E2-16 kDa [Westerdykella ornata]KAF2280202.1 ubiquitin-conjugating enzyme E2-16 kDa [Westerdykella ornata]
MSTGAKKRILREYAECQNDPLPGVKINFDEQNMTKWEILMDGPDQSVYAGGHYKLEINFPNEYPFKPPVVSFKTKIYHPNVSNDDKGSMCLGLLRPEEWKPPNKVISVLHLIRNLLIEPNPDDAIELSIANDYKTNRAEFDKTAKDWVKRYAK